MGTFLQHFSEYVLKYYVFKYYFYHLNFKGHKFDLVDFYSI